MGDNVMKLISYIAILLASTAYFMVGLELVNAMESTRIADLGYNWADVYLLGFACVLFLSGTFGFLFVAITANKL